MDTVLRFPVIGIEIALPWKRILRGILMASFCFLLYVCVLIETRSYEKLPKCDVIELHTAVSEKDMNRQNILDEIKSNVEGVVHGLSENICAEIDVVSDISESVSANTVITDPLGSTVADSVPAVMPEPVSENSDSMVLPDVTVPDATVPDVAEVNEVNIERKEVSGFVCDEEGMIIDYTDAVIVTDGILVIPTDEGINGIKSGSLDGLSAEVIEIYIPSNISYIEPGVFDKFASLLFIEVVESNPSYYSRDGILYSKSGELVVFPHGRPAESLYE